MSKNKNEIVIKPIIKNKENRTKVHDDLPSPSFFICIVGMRRSGKSVLTQNLISRDDLYGGTFKPENIIIMSPTNDLSDDFAMCKKAQKFSNIAEFGDITSEVMDTQTDIIKGHGRAHCPNVLLVYDDCVDSGLFRLGGKLETLAMRGRHLNISVIIISQRLHAIGRSIRLNSDAMILYSCSNFSEIESFLVNYAPNRFKKFLMKKVDEIFNIPYEFIYVFNGAPRGSRIRQGFHTPIIMEE